MEEPYALEEEAGALLGRGCCLKRAWLPFTLQVRLRKQCLTSQHFPCSLPKAGPAARAGIVQ